MRSKRQAAALLLTLALMPGPVRPAAQMPDPAAPTVLQLEALLARSAHQSPQIIEALANVRAAEGKREAAEGAFDTVLSFESSSQPSGYYENIYADAKVARPLASMGGQLYGGYRASDGRFPVYEDKSYTNRLGEIRAGVVFSLLRDRMIDERRFGRVSAQAEKEIADAQRQMVAIGVQRKALDAYLAWVAAGERLRVHRQLLDLARERHRGLQAAVDSGLRPRLILTENDQLVLRRQALVVQAEQALAGAANALSLYWRDETGTPKVPLAIQLPSGLPAALRHDAPDALARPDLEVARLRERLVQDRLVLDRNALLPRLELQMEVARDLGEPGLGGVSRDGNDVRLGLRFSVPIEQRSVRGRLAQTEAELLSNRARMQWLDEQIRAEVQGIRLALDGLARVITLTEAEQARALEMASAERRRFDMGASDLFLVNAREEAAGSVALSLLELRVRQIAASADMAAASGNAEALGL